MKTIKDGYTGRIAGDHFASWLPTETLRETLVHSSASRVVTTGSEASRQSGVSISKAACSAQRRLPRVDHRGSMATKLLMFSPKLARQLDGTGGAVNCLCSGFNVIRLGRDLSLAHPVAGLWLGIGNPERGAGAIVRLATDPVFGKQTGAYVSPKSARLLAPVAPANNEEARRQLWKRRPKRFSASTDSVWHSAALADPFVQNMVRIRRAGRRRLTVRSYSPPTPHAMCGETRCLCLSWLSCGPRAQAGIKGLDLTLAPR